MADVDRNVPGVGVDPRKLPRFKDIPIPNSLILKAHASVTRELLPKE